MTKPMDVLYVATEAEPFMKTGGMADLACNLPKSMKSMGHEIRIMLPGYGFINERRFHLHNLLRMKDIEIPIGASREQAIVKSSYITCDSKKVQVYFLSNDRYFSRPGLYFHPETKRYFPDNDERFIFFCRAVLETLKRLGWQPRIIHCNDWQCGLIPAYLKTIYKNDPFFRNTRTVFTAYSLAYHGTFPKSSYEKSGLPTGLFAGENGSAGSLNFLQAGMMFADVTTTLGVKADKKFTLENGGADFFSEARRRSIVSLTSTSPNGNRHEALAERFVSIYRDLAKNA